MNYFVKTRRLSSAKWSHVS